MGVGMGSKMLSLRMPRWFFLRGIKLKFPVFSLKSGKKLTLDSIFIYPDLLTFFNRRNNVDFKVNGYQGCLRGTFTGDLKNIVSSAALKWTFNGLYFKDIFSRAGGYDLRFSFKADGSGEFNKSALMIFSAMEKGTIRLHDFAGVTDNPLLEQMGLSSLDFTIVNIQYIHAGDDLKILELISMGPQMKITLKGHIILKKNFSSSILKLKGRVRPDPSFLSTFAGISSVSLVFSNLGGAGLPFTITGTLENPSASL